jgi:hypothetical protein
LQTQIEQMKQNAHEQHIKKTIFYDNDNEDNDGNNPVQGVLSTECKIYIVYVDWLRSLVSFHSELIPLMGISPTESRSLHKN